MAQRIILVDDLDQTEPAQTVTFSFEGVSYEIDLGPNNLEKFEASLAPFMESARRVGGRRRTAQRSLAATASSAVTNGAGAAKSDAEKRAKIRAWAAENDIPVPERGRIPEAVREQFEAAQQS